MLVLICAGGCEAEAELYGEPLSHWLEQLEHADPGVRRSAARSLSFSGVPEIVDALLARLRVEKDESVANNLANSFVSNLRHLRELETDPEAWDREEVAVFLGTGEVAKREDLPSPARWVPELTALLEDPDVRLRRTAAMALEAIEIHALPARDALIARMEDEAEDWTVRGASAYALVKIGQDVPEDAKGISAVAVSGPPDQRHVADWVRRGADGIPQLLAYARERSGSVAFPGARFARQQQEIFAELARMIEVGGEPREDALFLVRRIAPHGLEVLDRALEHEDAEVRRRAAEVLVAVRKTTSRTQPLLERVRSDPDPRVREAAAGVHGAPDRGR